MPRGGRVKTRDDPERRCIATGEVQPKRGLIRFAVGPDGQIVPDVLEKLPGRGIWVAAERSALVTAVEKKLFSRGAKRWGDQRIHPVVTLAGEKRWLKTPMIHYVDASISDMLRRLDRYTSARARDRPALSSTT